MKDCDVRPAGKPARSWRHGWALLAGTLVLVLAVVSCQTTGNRAVVVLPDVPGAKYIGSKECEQCHDKLYRDFATADHAKLIAAGTNALNAGCESCHGPCSLHSESGGETKPPFSFTAGRPQNTSYGARFQVDPPRARETVCFQCHTDVRGQFSLPSHHPAPEGRMSCSACHSPHKGSINVGGGTSLLSANDTCYRCHANKRGPYTFEHDAMREGCTVCHNVHGSVNAKLLTVRDSNLCLKCHFQQSSNGKVLIGGSDHTVRLQQGTCWTAGCHTAVHGSRVSPSLRF
jgi:predicted CXXCH cytochrome family protein